jgi:hypothetical protein
VHVITPGHPRAFAHNPHLSRSIPSLVFPHARARTSNTHSYMSSSSLLQWHPFTRSSHGCISCRNNGFFHSFNSIPGIGISLGSFLSVGLIFYVMFLSPHGLLLRSSKWSIPANHVSSPTSDEAPSSLSDVLSLEQIRDIVAPTRGFLSRDYSLHLGWNNVSVRGNSIRAELIILE